MPRYDVDVDFREVEPVSIEVEADSREQAEALAIKRANPYAWEAHVFDVQEITESGEGTDG